MLSEIGAINGHSPGVHGGPATTISLGQFLIGFLPFYLVLFQPPPPSLAIPVSVCLMQRPGPGGPREAGVDSRVLGSSVHTLGYMGAQVGMAAAIQTLSLGDCLHALIGQGNGYGKAGDQPDHLRACPGW